MHVREVSIESIIIPEDRQRTDLGNVEELADSIRRLGLINPITLSGLTLIAGERRLSACKHLNWKVINANQLSDLSLLDREALELEENVKRKSLTWQEETDAIARYHRLKLEQSSEWTMELTAEELGLPRTSIVKAVKVDEALNNADTKVIAATSVTQAYNTLTRREARVKSNALAELFAPEISPETEIVAPIIQADFLSWAPAYSGPPFSFIHCDFPYGLDITESKQGKAAVWESYSDDSQDLYWKLCKAMLDNLDKIAYPSAHIMHWFSMNYYQATIELFESYGLKLVQPQPLIWHKTDNTGILADTKRRSRHIYETALVFSRGDRFVVESVGNCHGCPSQKQHHQSEKPVPMLKHFFRMFVDSGSEVLDPTAGSGAAIRAAESLQAARVLGLEINADNVEISNQLINNDRRLRL